jgi:hypothetical protein
MTADEVQDEDDELPLRWWVIAAFMTVAIGGFVVAVLLSVLWYATCGDHHPGSVYVAGDSHRALACESGHGAAGALVGVGWVIGFLLATLALIRWRRGRLAHVVLSALLLTPLALPALAYGGLSLTSRDCSAEKQRAYEAWVEGGSKGTAPFNCRTF